MKHSDQITDFIARCEGFRDTAYRPLPTDRWTIGYGSTFYEDGSPVQKVLEVSNHTFVMGLRPIIERAERDGKSVVSVAAKKSGAGKGTVYMVMEGTL